MWIAYNCQSYVPLCYVSVLSNLSGSLTQFLSLFDHYSIVCCPIHFLISSCVFIYTPCSVKVFVLSRSMLKFVNLFPCLFRTFWIKGLLDYLHIILLRHAHNSEQPPMTIMCIKPGTNCIPCETTWWKNLENFSFLWRIYNTEPKCFCKKSKYCQLCFSNNPIIRDMVWGNEEYNI